MTKLPAIISELRSLVDGKQTRLHEAGLLAAAAVREGAFSDNQYILLRELLSRYEHEQPAIYFHALVSWLIENRDVLPVTIELEEPDLNWDLKWSFNDTNILGVADLLEKSSNGGTSLDPLTDLQKAILTALIGTALKGEKLADTACGGDKRRLYKPGGIKELMAADLVRNKPGVGYWRPDSPPLRH